MDNTTTRLITFKWGRASDQEWTLPEHENFQKHISSDDDFYLRVKKNQKSKIHKTQVWPKDPNVLKTFQAMIGVKFAPLTIMNSESTDNDLKITTFNTAVTEAASEILGKHRQKKTLGHCRNVWSVRQKEKSEKETNQHHAHKGCA